MKIKRLVESIAQKAILTTSAGLGIALMGMATPAHADVDVILGQANTGAWGWNVLEVLHSNKDDGAIVDNYRWNGSATQVWWMQSITDTETYFRLANANSLRMMDGYNNCTVHQYGKGVTSAQTQRMWRFGAWNENYEYIAYELHNRRGCNDDAYRDLVYSWPNLSIDGPNDVGIWQYYGENPDWIYLWIPFY